MNEPTGYSQYPSLIPLVNPMESKVNELIYEYHQWLEANHLPDLGSADEHLFNENLTDAQRKWLRDFGHRWERAQRD